MMDQSNTIHREIEIAADPATVFAFFTDPQRMTRWIGVSATIEPRPGGLFLIANNGDKARGEFKEVIPVSRLAYSFGWEGSDNIPPGSSLVEIDLLPRGAGTLVRLTHSGLPPEAIPTHTEGWAHYLARLALVASGRDPGPDTMVGRPTS